MIQQGKLVCAINLLIKLKGPYLVLKQLDDFTYLIRASPKMVPKVVHIDRLLPYRGSNLPKWFQDFKPKNN
jgi:hypothetical protein